MADTEKLLFQVLDALENLDKPPADEELITLVKSYAKSLPLAQGFTFKDEEIHDVVREVKTKFDISMGIGVIFKADDARAKNTSAIGLELLH